MMRRSESAKVSMGSLSKDCEEDLELFQNMRVQECSKFLNFWNEDIDIEASLRNADLQSEMLSEKESNDLLDPDKNDYDWLLTPPGTPLFPSLDQEVSMISFPEWGSVRTVSSQTSKILGTQKRLSTRVHCSMKESNSFSVTKDESILVRKAPSKAISRANSQFSMPSGHSYKQHASRLSFHNTHHMVTASPGTCLNAKISSSSTKYASTAHGISASKRLQTPSLASQVSIFPVTPPNPCTSISDPTDSAQAISAHSRHTGNPSVPTVTPHSMSMDLRDQFLCTTISTRPSISSCSSTSLDLEGLSPFSRQGSSDSPIQQVQAGSLSTNLEIASIYEQNFTRPHEGIHPKQSKNLSSSQEKLDNKNDEPNLDVSYASECISLFGSEQASSSDFILQIDRNLPTPDTSHVKCIQKLEIVRRREADMINVNGEISPNNVFQRAQVSCMSSNLNSPIVQNHLHSPDLDLQGQNILEEPKLELKDGQVLEKLDQCAKLELAGGETCCTAQTARHAIACVVPETVEGNIIFKPKYTVRPEATQINSDSSMEMVHEPILTSENFPSDLAASNCGALKLSSSGLHLSSRRQEGKRDFWSSKSAETSAASVIPEEQTDPDTLLLSQNIRQGVRLLEKDISPISMSVEHVPATLQETLLVEGNGVVANTMKDCAFMTITIGNDCEETNVIKDCRLHTFNYENGEDILQSEVQTILKSSQEDGEQFLEKQGICEDVKFGDTFVDYATGFTLNEEFHSTLPDKEVVKVLVSLEKRDESFLTYNLDNLQLLGCPNIPSADPSLCCLTSKAREIDHLHTYQEEAKDGPGFSERIMIPNGEDSFTKEKLHLLTADMFLDSDIVPLPYDLAGSHLFEKNEVTVLNFEQNHCPTSEICNLDCHSNGFHPSKLNVCEEDIIVNMTNNSTADDCNEGEKYNIAMQLAEPRINSSNAFKDEVSSHHSHVTVSGDFAISTEFTPSTVAITDVCAGSSSSFLWDKRLLDATDTILFCSSIVHDIIYRAITLAIEKEASSFVNFPEATNKNLPLLFLNFNSKNGIKGRAAKSCNIQAVGEERVARQKLIYMQQENRVDSKLVLHSEDSVSTMNIDVKQQRPMPAVVKNNKSEEMPGNDRAICHCTIS